MDKRTLLALVLMAIVIIVTPMIVPGGRPPTATLSPDTADVPPAAPITAPPAAVAAPAPAAPTVPADPVALPPAVTADTTVVATDTAHLALVSAGAHPVFVRLPHYADLRNPERPPAVLREPDAPLLRYRLVRGADTLALETVGFTTEHAGNMVTYTAPGISIAYTVQPEGYITHVRGQVADAPAGSHLLVDLPRWFESVEANPLDDLRQLTYAHLGPREVTTIGFGSLDPAVERVDPGPFRWVAARNRYFLVALMVPADAAQFAPGDAGQFTQMRMRGGPELARGIPRAQATAVQPIVNGQFGFDMFAGPQAWDHLRAAGHDLDQVNPFGGWLEGIVQPFATIVMRVVLWLRRTLDVNYGWVLVIFGVGVRLILWPFNQKAMRSSIRMQRLQPELQEIQKRYKEQPERQREAIMKVYQDHGMSPFSPLMGCLPMLLPMPVLIALYYVFQGTIEFRGVPFMWLPDLALKDPYYITPLFMGASMFLLSWIGMRAAPPTPQMKMISYMMPVMLTVIFINFASGLNLYYAVQNVAALPQQWLITRERQRAGPPPPVKATPPSVAAKPAAGQGGGKATRQSKKGKRANG